MKGHLAAIWLTLAFAASTFGQQHPNFSGTWRQAGLADRERICRIEHKDPMLTVNIDFTVMPAGGLGGSYSDKFQYRTDGSEETGTNTATGQQLWRTVYWQGAALVFLTVTKQGYRVSVTRETWSLSEDGRTLTKARRFINMDGIDEDTQIFRKQ